MSETIDRWRRLAECDALAGAPLGDALNEACNELERLRVELAETRAKLSDAVVTAEAHFTTYLETVAQRETLKAAIGRFRERHQPHDCHRDHNFARTPVPCVNADMCRCGSPLPCLELAAWNAARAAPETPEDAEPRPGWRERARARVGDQVAARMAELMAEPPLSAEEFDEAMRRNKVEAEAHLDRQSRGISETSPDAPTEDTEAPGGES